MYRQLQEEKIRRRRQSKIRFIEIFFYHPVSPCFFSIHTNPSSTILLLLSYCFTCKTRPKQTQINLISLFSSAFYIYIYLGWSREAITSFLRFSSEKNSWFLLRFLFRPIYLSLSLRLSYFSCAFLLLHNFDYFFF